MKKIHFDVAPDGFYGAYWPCPRETDCTIIAMLGDDPEDYMTRSAVKWLLKQNVNALTMSPGKKCYDHHNYPLERIETAMNCLKAHGSRKIGIAGASTTGTLALTAASYFPDLTLTIAMTASDFIWQGFMQGDKDGCKEWPIEGESLFTYRGEPLPYMPFCYQHPQYWRVFDAETKRTGNMLNSRKIFDDSEAAHPIREEEFIKVENIRGKLLLVAAGTPLFSADAPAVAGTVIRRNRGPGEARGAGKELPLPCLPRALARCAGFLRCTEFLQCGGLSRRYPLAP